MSTTFAVYVNDEPIEVARCFGIPNGEVDFVWLNKLGPLLDDRTRVYPMDNSPPNVYYIRDIKAVIAQNSPRGKALKWWRGLSMYQHNQLCRKHFPESPIEMTLTLDSRIEFIHKQETQ
jgi:hypothetical protein